MSGGEKEKGEGSSKGFERGIVFMSYLGVAALAGQAGLPRRRRGVVQNSCKRRLYFENGWAVVFRTLVFKDFLEVFY